PTSSASMHKFLIATFLALSLTVGSASSKGLSAPPRQDHQPVAGAAVPNETGPGTPVPITRLNPRQCPSCPFAGISGLKEKLQLVIRDQDAWRDIWKVINETKLQLPSLPEIDFSREMIVVVGLGQRTSGGYSILVDRAYEAGDQLQIDVV